MRLLWERAYPYLLGLIALPVAMRYMTESHKVTIMVELVNPLLGVIAILLGSIIASLSVVLTGQEMEPIKRMKATKHFRILVDYHTAGLLVGTIAFALSLVVLVYCKTTVRETGEVAFRSTTASTVIFYAWLFFVVCSLTTFYRIGKILTRFIMQFITSPPPRQYRNPPAPQVVETIETVETEERSLAVSSGAA